MYNMYITLYIYTAAMTASDPVGILEHAREMVQRNRTIHLSDKECDLHLPVRPPSRPNKTKPSDQQKTLCVCVCVCVVYINRTSVE